MLLIKKINSNKIRTGMFAVYDFRHQFAIFNGLFSFSYTFVWLAGLFYIMRMVRLFLKLSHDFIWSQLYKTLDQFSIKLSKSNVLQHFVNIKIYFFQGNERLYNKLIINYFLQLNVKFVDHLTGFFFFYSFRNYQGRIRGCRPRIFMWAPLASFFLWSL